MASEAEHLVEVDFDGFDVGAEEVGDGLGVEPLGITGDDDDQRTAFDVLGVEGAKVVDGETGHLLGEVGTEVALPA